MIFANGSYTSNKDKEINQQQLNEYYLEHHKKKNRSENDGKDERKFDAPQMTSFHNIDVLQQMVNPAQQSTIQLNHLKMYKETNISSISKCFFFN